MSVPSEGPPGRRPPSTGGVSVLYGGPEGVSAAGNQLWLPSSPGLDWGHDDVTDSWFGLETAAGDFDGDGFADLAIGTFDWEQVNVLYGSDAGLTTQRDQRWTSTTPGLVPGVPAYGSQYTQFGGVLETGDFDGDGFADLALGIADEPDLSEAVGHVRILYGSAAGLAIERNQDWSEGTPGVLGVPDGCCDGFGSTLVAGDFGRGPQDDLAIAEPGDRGGFVHVLFGGVGVGLTADHDQIWSQDSAGVPGHRTDGDRFGSALAAGDLGGRAGLDDLAIGAPGADGGAGAVVVLYARGHGFEAADSQEWTQDSPFVEDEAEPGDGFGTSLATGNFNVHSHEDLAIGVPGENSATLTDSGGVEVLYNAWTTCSPSGFDTLCADEDQLWTLDAPGLPGRAATDGLFGHALSSRQAPPWSRHGPIPADDLVVGVPGHSVRRFLQAGAAAVIYGTDLGGLTSTGSQLWSLDSPGVLGDPGRLERFGNSVG